MLNKSVCRECYLKGCNNPLAWDRPVERMWKMGRVWCVEFHEEVKITAYVGEAKTEDPPPRWCKYALEHTVSEKPDAEG